jgi:hypothetical protein
MKKRIMNTARATTTAVKRGLPLGSRVTSVGFGSKEASFPVQDKGILTYLLR